MNLEEFAKKYLNIELQWYHKLILSKNPKKVRNHIHKQSGKRYDLVVFDDIVSDE